jgi:lysozyme
MARPTPEAIEWLKKREGRPPKSYLDSLGKLTGGYGHLMSEEDSLQYPEGADVGDMTADLWLAEDSQDAWKAAEEQAKELGKPEMVEPLFHVNYQLGTSWNKEHKGTWKKLKEGRSEDAAVEAANSKWFKQTPKRVRDFQMALTGRPREEEY